MTQPPPDLGLRLAGDPLAAAFSAAAVDATLAHGLARLEVADILSRAGVGREQFDRRFEGVEDCVLAVYEAYIADFVASVQAAYEGGRGWRESLRAAAYAAAAWIVEHPRETRFGMVEVLAAEAEMIRVRREQIFAWCAGLIDAGRAEAPDPDSVPPAAAVVAIGSIAEMLTKRVRSGHSAEPFAFVPELMYLAVRPYLGQAAASEELRMPPAGHGSDAAVEPVRTPGEPPTPPGGGS